MKLFLWQTFKIISLLFFLRLGLKTWKMKKEYIETFLGEIFQIHTLILALCLFIGFILWVILIFGLHELLNLNVSSFFDLLKYVWEEVV